MKAKYNTKNVFVEISGRCNAKCTYCAQSRLKEGNYFGEMMTPALFEQILDHLFKTGILSKNVNYIDCYNWGEPLLNPKINEILQILKDKKLKVGISSNFINAPRINKELLPVINNVLLSISGFTQESYGKIHAAPLDKTLNNFKNFYEDMREYSPQTPVWVRWHRYLFNEQEFWDAHKYFNRLGIPVKPVIAYLNDYVKMQKFVNGELSQDEISKIEKDIFLDSIKESILFHKKKSKNYYCPEWDAIVVDETGQLLVCCGYTRYDSGSGLGNILDMSLEEIFNKKSSASLCDGCISSGLARWAHHLDLSLPPGGGVYGFNARIYHNFKKTCYGLIKTIPYAYSEKIIRTLKQAVSNRIR